VSDQEQRPLQELRLLLMLTDKMTASTFGIAEFCFPLMVFEDNQAALLIPEPACEQVIGNWEEMLPRLINEAAAVDIPYNPPVERDIHGYIFNVMIAYLDSNTPALAEALMLQKYAPRIWERYSELSHPFEFS
jgi:hypothetical protein